MNIKENDKMVSVHFDSIIELMDFEPENRNNKYEFDNYINGKSRRIFGAEWLGVGATNYKEVIEKAMLGDQDIYNRALKMMSILNSGKVIPVSQHIKKVKRRKIRSDMGDELDIHKVYQGNLAQAWSKTERIEVDAKHHLVTLFLNINGNSGVKVSETIWRCALILKLANEIQQAGKSLKIIVGGMVTRALIGSSKLLTTSITVKKYNETLSPERLAAMTNIGFYRTFGFAAKHCQNLRVEDGGGRSSTIYENNMPIHLQEEVDKGHTKPVFLEGIRSQSSMINELERAFKQMKNFQ